MCLDSRGATSPAAHYSSDRRQAVVPPKKSSHLLSGQLANRTPAVFITLVDDWRHVLFHTAKVFISLPCWNLSLSFVEVQPLGQRVQPCCYCELRKIREKIRQKSKIRRKSKIRQKSARKGKMLGIIAGIWNGKGYLVLSLKHTEWNR